MGKDRGRVLWLVSFVISLGSLVACWMVPWPGSMAMDKAVPC